MDVVSLLFSTRKDIKCIKTKSVKTNTMGPAELGVSKFRVGTKKIAKYSSVALFMDEILINHSVNALESEGNVYTEFALDGIQYAAICDGESIDWKEHAPVGDYREFAALPLFMYALKQGESRADIKSDAQKELADAFSNACAKFNSYDTLEPEDLLLLCDSFYYVFVKDHTDIESNDESLAPETIESGYSTGLFSNMKAMDSVKGKPDFNVKIKKRRTSKKTEQKNVANKFDECMEGKHRIAYEWKEEQKVFIPSLSTLSTYVPDSTYFSILTKIENRLGKVMMRMDAGKTGVEAIANDYVNLTIAGKPGTGKTVTAYALGAALGVPTYTVALSKNSEEDTFEGVTKVVDGKLSFISTDFLEAYTNGGIIILEEVNLADPAVIMGAIGQAVEFPFVLKKNGYETVRRHPLCVIISTMNIGTYGSKGVNQAFASRFKQSYILDDPTKEQFVKILEMNGFENKKCVYVYEAYNRIVNYLKDPKVNAEDICLNLSIRGCLGALQNMEDGDEPAQAIVNSLVGKIYEVDPEVAADVKKNVIKTLVNL